MSRTVSILRLELPNLKKKNVNGCFFYRIKKFSCHESTCGAVFHNIFEFEMHYNSCHRYVCSECKAARPTPRLLDIHIEETHDVFFGVLSKKQPMVSCIKS